MGKSYTSSAVPIVFDIDGEEFHARKMAGAIFIDFFRRRATATDPELAEMLYQGFASAMEESEFERFWKRCSSDVDLDTMQQIFQDLTAATAARPTKPSSPSSPGRRRAKAAAGSSAVAPMSNGSKEVSETSAT